MGTTPVTVNVRSTVQRPLFWGGILVSQYHSMATLCHMILGIPEIAPTEKLSKTFYKSYISIRPHILSKFSEFIVKYLPHTPFVLKMNGACRKLIRFPQQGNVFATHQQPHLWMALIKQHLTKWQMFRENIQDRWTLYTSGGNK